MILNGYRDRGGLIAAYVSGPRARKEEDDKQHEREVPRVDSMSEGGEKGGEDASWCKGLLRVGAIAEQEYRRSGNDWLHDE